MNRHVNLGLWLVLVLLVVLIGLMTGMTLANAAHPAAGNYSLNWTVVGTSGQVMESGDLRLRSTSGQPAASLSNGQTTDLTSGFWPGMKEREKRLFLPLLIRR